MDCQVPPWGQIEGDLFAGLLFAIQKDIRCHVGVLVKDFRSEGRGRDRVIVLFF